MLNSARAISVTVLASRTNRNAPQPLSKSEQLTAESITPEIEERLTHSHTMTPFDAPGKQAFENTVEKREIARYEQFLLFPQCFLPV